MSEMKGLVLEGGGFRGMYTCGVIDVFMENGICFDEVVGVSAGAAFGCNIKSKQIGRALRYNKRFCRDSRYSGLKSFIKTGDLYNKEFAYGIVPTILDPFDTKTFRENPLKFTVVCTDIHTGNPVYHEIQNGDATDIEWIRASASIPIVSKPVKLDGYELLDGGVSDSIPVNWMLERSDKTVIVLTRDKSYHKEPMKYIHLLKKAFKEYPNLQKALENRYIVYNKTLDEIEQLEREGKVFVIRPSKPIACAMIEKDPDHLQEIYDIGRRDALHYLEDLKKYL
ncbi:patatin-like phospholipase family protein [Holdemanella biformis]|uniref:patatin-like phospholipase family protein n=1 Tax=Holdemanella biformis TaxID=1735 RepID=UPI00265DEB26|nr:patatin family protein [Holdemanella biformis]MEE0473400.1 patatin family protein [Holdemanella biformis]